MHQPPKTRFLRWDHTRCTPLRNAPGTVPGASQSTAKKLLGSSPTIPTIPYPPRWGS